MEDSESIANCFDKIQELVNVMRACKEKVTDQQVVDKILRTLLIESKDLDTMEVEELQHSLEAHEMMVNKRKVLKEQALQAQTNYKGKRQRNTKIKNLVKLVNPLKKGQKQGWSSKNSKEWKFDKRKMRCHNYQKLGHYAKECWAREGAKNKPNNRAHLAQDEG
ncbi:hypothetical protein CR513_35157, partial [Mucuna pruriens]